MLGSSLLHRCTAVTALWLTALALLSAATSQAKAETLFRALEGSWSGSGRITLEGGNVERLSCRASYSTRGSTGLGLAIRCASSSYKIELRSALSHTGGSVNGTWEERSFNAEGTVAGRVAASTLNLVFRGNVAGGMSVSVSGRQQRVLITSSGGPFRVVSIRLARSG